MLLLIRCTGFSTSSKYRGAGFSTSANAASRDAGNFRRCWLPSFSRSSTHKKRVPPTQQFGPGARAWCFMHYPFSQMDLSFKPARVNGLNLVPVNASPRLRYMSHLPSELGDLLLCFARDSAARAMTDTTPAGKKLFHGQRLSISYFLAGERFSRPQCALTVDPYRPGGFSSIADSKSKVCKFSAPYWFWAAARSQFLPGQAQSRQGRLHCPRRRPRPEGPRLSRSWAFSSSSCSTRSMRWCKIFANVVVVNFFHIVHFVFGFGAIRIFVQGGKETTRAGRRMLHEVTSE